MKPWMLAISVTAGFLLLSTYLLFTMPSAADLAARRMDYDAAMARAHLPPVQTATTASPIAYGKFRLVPRAAYDVTARVMSARRYHSNLVDHFVDVSPEDLALGWGRFADNASPQHIRIWQEDRFFKYRYDRDMDVPRDELISSLANTHIVPANDEAARQLKHVGKGDLIHMTGQLIDVVEPGYGIWNTSLVRTDTGPGACEILWLEKLEIIPEP